MNNRRLSKITDPLNLLYVTDRSSYYIIPKEGTPDKMHRCSGCNKTFTIWGEGWDGADDAGWGVRCCPHCGTVDYENTFEVIEKPTILQRIFGG